MNVSFRPWTRLLDDRSRWRAEGVDNRYGRLYSGLASGLVAAFHSTLEEAIDADLLLHVVDISDPNYLDKIGVVEKVLEELGAEKDRIITVFNKVDLLEDHTGSGPKGSIYLSARSGQGLEDLMGIIAQRLDMDKSDYISPI